MGIMERSRSPLKGRMWKRTFCLWKADFPPPRERGLFLGLFFGAHVLLCWWLCCVSMCWCIDVLLILIDGGNVAASPLMDYLLDKICVLTCNFWVLNDPKRVSSTHPSISFVERKRRKPPALATSYSTSSNPRICRSNPPPEAYPLFSCVWFVLLVNQACLCDVLKKSESPLHPSQGPAH